MGWAKEDSGFNVLIHKNCVESLIWRNGSETNQTAARRGNSKKRQNIEAFSEEQSEFMNSI